MIEKTIAFTWQSFYSKSKSHFSFGGSE